MLLCRGSTCGVYCTEYGASGFKSGSEAGDVIPPFSPTTANEAGPPEPLAAAEFSLARLAPRFMLPQLEVEGSWSWLYTCRFDRPNGVAAAGCSDG